MKVRIAFYLHLPFCVRKCRYCDFNSRPASEAERDQYLQALRCEIAGRAHELADGLEIATIYFGGGTPTLYDAGDLAGVLDLIAEAFAVSSDAEITVEANPETLDAAKLRGLVAAGVNRLSIGAQSFSDAELALLGRGHRAADTVRAVELARAAGFRNLSLDLIYALPDQTVADWERTLAYALTLRPDHLSAYGLSIEPGTPLAADVAAGRLRPVDEQVHLAMRQLTGALCAAEGLQRYEISNYARSGRRCRHNMVYWRNGEYLGVGAGAVSYLAGVRSENRRDPADYTRSVLAGDRAPAARERLDAAGRMAETVMLGLRLVEGLELAELEREFSTQAVAQLRVRSRPLVEAGLLEERDGRMFLTEAGQNLHSEVAARLM